MNLTKLWLAVPAVLVGVAGCTSGSSGGAGEGNGESPSPTETLVDSTYFDQRFKQGETAYVAQYLVLDRDDAPVKGAELRIGSKAARTDEDGLASIDGDVSQPEPIRVVASGYVPRVVIPKLADALRGETEVRLHRVSDPFEIDATERATLVRDGGQVQLQQASLTYENGVRAEQAMVALEVLEGGEIDGMHALADDGDEQQAIEAVLGGLFVEPKSKEGHKLQLADDTRAVIDIPVPGDSAAAGDRMQLASLDEQSGTFKLESECEVRAISAAEDAPLACRGAVSHFSTWTAVKVVKRAPPTACVSADVGNYGEYGVIDYTRLDCNRERCIDRSYDFWPVVVLKGSEVNHFSKGWIGRTTHVGSDITHLVFMRRRERKQTKFVNPDGSSQVVRYLTDYTAVKLDKLGELKGDPNSDPDACTLRIEIPTEWKVIDEDGDGFFPKWDFPPSYRDGVLLRGGVDCNDRHHFIRPSNREQLCNDRDDDCNPATPDSGRYTDMDPYTWNAKCKSSCAVVEDDEIPGNLYDENCDGKLADLDGDGADERRDCDDLNPDAHPGGEEVASNQTDEDCDGEFVDFDGDGHLFTRHGWLLPEEQLGDMPADDCNDVDPEVHGGRSAEDEAGQLATFFTPDGARLASFCGYFESDGSASSIFRYAFRDLDCDGRFTDLDGDGEDSPRDCDDTDPRVTPGDDAEASCEVPDDLDNRKACMAAPAGTGDRCPVLFGGARHSRCLGAMNSDGTLADIGLCNFFGWETSEPLVAEPGVAWGPCDGGEGILPECADGLQCAGGGKEWSPALKNKLAEWTNGAIPVPAFQGMCFPLCDP